MDGINDLLGKLLVQVYSPNEHVRNAAASRIYSYLLKNDLHPTDLTVLDVDFTSTWRETFDRLQKLDRENEFLRRHVSSAVLRKAAIAGEIDYRWPELFQLISERLLDKCGVMPRSWRKHVADLCGISTTTLSMWEAGTARIPEQAFTAINAVAPIVKKIKAAKSRVSQSSQRKVVTHNQLAVLQGITAQPGCTIRSLSFHLYGEPDTNETLADVVSQLLKRKLLYRQPIIRNKEVQKDKSKWAYFINEAGTQLLNMAA